MGPGEAWTSIALTAEVAEGLGLEIQRTWLSHLPNV